VHSKRCLLLEPTAISADTGREKILFRNVNFLFTVEEGEKKVNPPNENYLGVNIIHELSPSLPP